MYRCWVFLLCCVVGSLARSTLVKVGPNKTVQANVQTLGTYDTLEAALKAFQQFQAQTKVPPTTQTPTGGSTQVFNSSSAAWKAYNRTRTGRKRRSVQSATTPTTPSLTGQEPLVVLYCLSGADRSGKYSYNYPYGDGIIDDFKLWMMRQVPEVRRNMRDRVIEVGFGEKFDLMMNWLEWRKAVEIWDRKWGKRHWPRGAIGPRSLVKTEATRQYYIPCHEL